MKTFTGTTVAVGLLCAAPFAAHATDGYVANGYGMKAIGMAGAAVAVAQEPFGGAVNPGAMSFLDSSQWQLGVSWFSPRRSASRTGGAALGLDGSADSDSEHFFIPEFGINWRYRPDLALGVTVYGNGGMNTDYPGGQLPSPGACGPATAPGNGFNPAPGPYNLLCGNGRLGVDLIQVMIAPYASWQFVKGHSVGVTPIVAYQRFRAEGLQAFDNPFLSTSPGDVTNRGHSDSWGFGARIGYMGQLTDALAIGGSWQSKISMENFDEYKGLFAQQGGFDIPSTFTLGVALRPTRQWLIAVDFQRIYYDDAKSVNNRSALIYNCAGGQRTNCLGGDDGAGFGWQNVDVWKIGVQYDVNDAWTVRGGYNRSDNPIQPQDVTFNILAPGVVQNQYHLGATWRLDKVSEITGMFMYADTTSVTGSSLINGFLPPGSPQMTETIKMNEYQLGIAYNRKF